MWVSLPNLPIFLFDKTALFSIGRLIRSPLTTDLATADIKRPSLAKICIEVDLLKTLPTRVWLESGDAIPGFWQDVEYDKIPKYCRHCKRVGHDVKECKFANPHLLKTSKPQPQQKKQYMYKKETNIEKDTPPQPNMQTTQETIPEGQSSDHVEATTEFTKEATTEKDKSTPAAQNDYPTEELNRYNKHSFTDDEQHLLNKVELNPLKFKYSEDSIQRVQHRNINAQLQVSPWGAAHCSLEDILLIHKKWQEEARKENPAQPVEVEGNGKENIEEDNTNDGFTQVYSRKNIKTKQVGTKATRASKQL